MPSRFAASARTMLVLLATGGMLAGCTHAETAVLQAEPEAPAAGAPKPAAVAASAPAPAAPMTREQASTDCWMKYEKEGRGLSLDQRLPLVEKCTAAKLKAGR